MAGLARAERPFRYLRDPLFLACVALYFANRFLLKPYFRAGTIGAFCHDALNDLICLPFWLPIMVWLMRKAGLRREDAPPRGFEVMIPLLFWSWVFEGALPAMPIFRGMIAPGDSRDIVWYAAGAIGAVVFWDVFYGVKGR